MAYFFGPPCRSRELITKLKLELSELGLLVPIIILLSLFLLLSSSSSSSILGHTSEKTAGLLTATFNELPTRILRESQVICLAPKKRCVSRSRRAKFRLRWGRDTWRKSGFWLVGVNAKLINGDADEKHCVELINSAARWIGRDIYQTVNYGSKSSRFHFSCEVLDTRGGRFQHRAKLPFLKETLPVGQN